MSEKSHFIDLPEPPTRGDDSIKDKIRDDYLTGMEEYITALHNHLLTIQKDETRARQDFSNDLQKLATEKPGRRRANQERDINESFQGKMKKNKAKRKHFRQMLFDAYNERKKLIESMKIQRHEEEVLRRKLQQLVAIDTQPAEKMPNLADAFIWLVLAFQVLNIILFWAAADFSSNPNDPTNTGFPNRAANYYTLWVHIALMVLLGFSFLYTFMRKYAYTAITQSFLIVALAVQWTILNRIFWDNVDEQYGPEWARGNLTPLSLVEGYYGAAACLISFGVVLGKMTPYQLLVITFCEVMWYSLNHYICVLALGARDIGGTKTVHVFGCYFGLALMLGKYLVSYFLGEDTEKDKFYDRDRQPSYHSNVFSIFGTLIMFVFWPGWNAVFAPDGSQFRVVVNTLLSITSSVIFAFLSSRTIRSGKFLMTDIQHATLAGGIAIGSATPLVVTPGGAMVIGMVAGIVSVLSIAYMTPLLENKLKIVDVAGVHNLHGLPGILGGVAGIISTAIAGQHDYIFGQKNNVLFDHGSHQSGYQTAALAISLALGIGGGFATGIVTTLLKLLADLAKADLTEKPLYTDERQFHVPADFERTASAPLPTEETVPEEKS